MAKKKGSTPRQRRIASERAVLGSNINYQYWRQGFADLEAKRTGRRPSEYTVSRSPVFQKHVDTILGHNPKGRHGPRSPLARALEAVGMRDPRYKGNVGNSGISAARRTRDAKRRRRRARVQGKPGRHS